MELDEWALVRELLNNDPTLSGADKELDYDIDNRKYVKRQHYFNLLG